MTAFWETKLPLTLKRQGFVPFFKTCANYGLDPVQDLDPEQKPFTSRNLCRNTCKSLRFHNVSTFRKVPSVPEH
jgi:hypothetical protein